MSSKENGESNFAEFQKKKSNKMNATEFDYAEIEQMLPEHFDDLYKTLPLTEETTCGLWLFKGELWQK